MIIDFGANVVVTQTWTELKAIVQAKSLQLQYVDDTDTYTPFAIDAGIVYRATIFKGTVPTVNDWNQVTNDAWETDFVTNFLPTANARIKDAVDTSGTATVTGSVNSDMQIGGTAVSASNPVPMSDGGGSISVDGTFWQATQPVSAVSLPLPTGAATEATLAAVSGKLPATLGQKTNGNSLAVTIASDQTAVPVSDGGGSLTIDATTLPLPTGAATAALQTTGNSSLSSIDGKTPALGQAAMTASTPVVIASNQTAIPITDNGGSLTVDGTVAATQSGTWTVQPGNTANTTPWLASISQGGNTAAVKSASTAPLATDQALVVVLSPNQPSIPITSAPSNSTPGLTLGDITTAATTRVAVRRTAYTEQTSNAQRSLVSANANDTSAGTGARTVKITYLDATGAGPYTETLTMNGTTAVNTVATNICFIENIEVETAGSTGSNVGIISLRAATGGGGATIWTIAATDNRTFGCHHYVPTGKTANIGSQWAGHTGTVVGSGATFTINRKPIGVANAVEKQISDSFRLYGQSSSVQRDYDTPIKAVGPCRLQTYVTPETSSSINYRASFDWYEE